MRIETRLDMALWLMNEGCSVFPLLPKSKKPFADLLPDRSWKEYQTRLARPDEVYAWWSEHPEANIALVCGAVSGIVAVDVDGEQGQEWFKAHMPKPNLFQFTSSKHKFHAFYRHPRSGVVIPPGVKLVPEVDVRGDGSYVVFALSVHPSGAVYSLKKMAGFDGMESLVAVPDLPVRKSRDGSGYEWAGGSDAEAGSVSGNMFDLHATEGERNDKLTSLCGRLYARGLREEEVLLAAIGWNTTHCTPPLPEAEVKQTVHSMSGTHRGRNPFASNAGGVSRWVQTAEGEFTLADIYRDLTITNAEDKLRCQGEIKALLDRGQIERCGSRNGWFRRKENTLEVIDLAKPEEPRFDLWLPFNLHHNVILQPKNIIVVAGETNSGKTGLLFNLAFMNMEKRHIRYLTSEMTGNEIRDRIQSFGKPLSAWGNVEFIERASNFQDAIDPDGVNIIDFLEVHDKFYAVGEEIKKVFEALRGGVVFIALQKKTGELFGRGGEFGLEKARLAMSLFTHGRLPDGIVGSAKITKSKKFVPGRNPDGKEQFYTLKKGFWYDNAPIENMFRRGFHFYPKKERDKLISKLENYCKRVTDETVADQMADFYGVNQCETSTAIQ